MPIEFVAATSREQLTDINTLSTVLFSPTLFAGQCTNKNVTQTVFCMFDYNGQYNQTFHYFYSEKQNMTNQEIIQYCIDEKSRGFDPTKKRTGMDINIGPNDRTRIVLFCIEDDCFFDDRVQNGVLELKGPDPHGQFCDFQHSGGNPSQSKIIQIVHKNIYRYEYKYNLYIRYDGRMPGQAKIDPSIRNDGGLVNIGGATNDG
ncbi:MAG: hypothetical protein MI755_20215 [Sphingomonadales bacterium]|nr:hypothetical protein [Sphingomonadales bacterium]